MLANNADKRPGQPGAGFADGDHRYSVKEGLSPSQRTKNAKIP